MSGTLYKMVGIRDLTYSYSQKLTYTVVIMDMNIIVLLDLL